MNKKVGKEDYRNIVLVPWDTTMNCMSRRQFGEQNWKDCDGGLGFARDARDLASCFPIVIMV